MLTKGRRIQLLGIGLGLILIGLTRAVHWTQLAAIWLICATLFAVVSPRFYEKNARITSVGVWMATGMTTIPAVAWLLGGLESNLFAWAVTAWLAFSIILGLAWPFPFAKRLANGN